MKKHLYAFIIILISLIFVFFNSKKEPQYKILNVYNADSICIDLNKNSTCDNNENIKLYGFEKFPSKFGKSTLYIKEKYGINEEHSVVLSILADEYAKKELLNKYVKVKILDDNNENYKLATIYLNDIDFSQTILKNGWATSSYNNEDYKLYENLPAIKKNITYSKNFNYQLRNKKNGKIHTLTCEYGRKTKEYEIGIFDDAKYKKDYCHICHKIDKDNEIIKFQKKNFDYSSNDIKIYFLDFSDKLKPKNDCSEKSCKILLNNINNAKNSIDFAIYGMGNIPKIENALINAQNRGVKVRFVFDEDNKQENIYPKTKKTIQYLKNHKSDYSSTNKAIFNNNIMHNKFFIFDNETVWLGTANISDTDLSSFNANNVILIKSKEFAKIYEDEFNQMYDGNFHTRKKHIDNKKLIVDNSEINIYFSPQDKIITNQLIPKIEQAKKYIYISTFTFTHKALAEKLITAQKRGIKIKVIIDATSASNKYSMVKFLRSSGIPVKIENRAGKMHMKTILIDDEYFISGSMNLTKSAENYNDENLVFIKNNQVTKQGKDFFEYLWQNIPDKYLKQYISAESTASIGSCYDGIDNDYNGFTDKNDPKCK